MGPAGDGRKASWGVPAYERWIAEEGVPVHTGMSVRDVRVADIGSWERTGARGAYVRLDGAEDTTGAYLLELDPAKGTNPERHLFEEWYHVLDGSGTLQVWDDTGRRSWARWRPGSLFAVPLNVHHRLVADDGRVPARLLDVTDAPLIINLFHNVDFVFGCPFDLTDRFVDNFFQVHGVAHRGMVLETNFIEDVSAAPLERWPERGGSGASMLFELGNNTLAAHVSVMPPGVYKKAHRHAPGAHILILEGEGYTLTWKREGDTPAEIEWWAGSLFAPPGWWWHQHFNIGNKPARYLAIRWGSQKWPVTPSLDVQGASTSYREGGNQLDYEDQDPSIHEHFVERRRQHSAHARSGLNREPSASVGLSTILRSCNDHS